MKRVLLFIATNLADAHPKYCPEYINAGSRLERLLKRRLTAVLCSFWHGWVIYFAVDV